MEGRNAAWMGETVSRLPVETEGGAATLGNCGRPSQPQARSTLASGANPQGLKGRSPAQRSTAHNREVLKTPEEGASPLREDKQPVLHAKITQHPPEAGQLASCNTMTNTT